MTPNLKALWEPAYAHFKNSLTHFAVSTRASTRENLTVLQANSKGADQPAHPPSLISAFVVLAI